ncbi:hypothetical protein [Bradyrhizobium sp.]|nr:hypothetical protein [Bradyrhizobium sp.]HMM90677.1 hypothetical protein [Bradyrhizobium sp.]
MTRKLLWTVAIVVAIAAGDYFVGGYIAHYVPGPMAGGQGTLYR